MPILPTIRELERVRLTCPLGIRFWDDLTGRVVGEDLVVSAEPPGRPELARQGLLNRRNGFVFPHLPGLRAVELGDDQSPFPASPPLEREYVIRVADPEGRFLPLSFRVIAPHQGWFQLPNESPSPNRPADSVPLFSSPGRLLNGGIAVVRADLWDFAADAPAAWALLEVEADTPTGTKTVRGLADAEGRVLLAFAYPEMAPALLSGSPSAGRAGLSAQGWDLTVRVSYSALPVSDDEPPDLGEILGQAAATLLNAESPATALTNARLSFGQELILRSSGDGQGRVWVRR